MCSAGPQLQATLVVVGRAAVVQGSCHRTSGGREEAITAGAVLHTGDVVEVGPDGALELATADGSDLWLCAETQVVCIGPRSNQQPTLRLLKGEIRAEMAPDPSRTFGVQTPAGSLRVLGTEFHCRVFSQMDEQQEDPNVQKLKNTFRRAIPSAMLLTVLTGSVSVQTAAGDQVVHAGQRALTLGDAASTTEPVAAGMDYIRRWLAKPGGQQTPEGLYVVNTRPYLLNALWAVNPSEGAARHVTDFLGSGADISARLGSDLALVNRGSVIFAFFGDEPVSGSGGPFVNDMLYLVNLSTGEKLEMTPLKAYDPLYIELSPDRRKLAFNGDRRQDATGSDAEREGGVYVLDLETFKVRRLLRGDIKTAPHWSPDSRWIAVSKAENYVDKHAIVLIDTISEKVVETGIDGAGVYYTPDGKQILFSAQPKKGGSWGKGVPNYGNLFLADVPQGKPQQLTHLPKGGASQPSFSPNGSLLAYWETLPSKKDSDGRALHMVDMETRTDEVVIPRMGLANVEWTSGEALFVAPFSLDGKPAPVKLVEHKAGKWTVHEMTPQIPAPTPDETKAAAAFSDELMGAFRVYRNAVDARDLHELDKALAAYRLGRDMLVNLSQKLAPAAGTTANPSRPLKLSPTDLAPYIDAFNVYARMSRDQLLRDIVHSNMEFYFSSFLSHYYGEKKKLPDSMDELATQALAGKWQINHIAAKDQPRAKHLLVVPGEDPDTVTTSYKLVTKDDANGTCTIESPILPGGKKLRAEYRMKEAHHGDWAWFRAGSPKSPDSPNPLFMLLA